MSYHVLWETITRWRLNIVWPCKSGFLHTQFDWSQGSLCMNSYSIWNASRRLMTNVKYGRLFFSVICVRWRQIGWYFIETHPSACSIKIKEHDIACAATVGRCLANDFISQQSINYLWCWYFIFHPFGFSLDARYSLVLLRVKYLPLRWFTQTSTSQCTCIPTV